MASWIRKHCLASICVVGMLTTLALCAGCAEKETTTTSGNNTAQSSEPVASAQPSETPTQTYTEVNVAFTFEANDHWTANSTPIIVHITGTSDSGSAVDQYYGFPFDATKPQENTTSKNRDATITLAPGTYNIEYGSPINDDGTMYIIDPEHGTVVHNNQPSMDVLVPMNPVAQPYIARDDSADDYTKAIDMLTAAADNDAPNLSGDQGQMFVKRAWQYYEASKMNAQ